MWVKGAVYTGSLAPSLQSVEEDLTLSLVEALGRDRGLVRRSPRSEEEVEEEKIIVRGVVEEVSNRSVCWGLMLVFALTL